MTSSEKRQWGWNMKFWIKVLISILVLPVVLWIWPHVIPFSFFEFWGVRGTIIDWLYSAWPLLAFGTGGAIVKSVFTNNDRYVNHNAEKIVVLKTFLSVLTGIIEEVTFRWLFFLSNIIFVKIGNFLFFGFLGFGILAWLHTKAFGPIANTITLYYLEPYIFHYTGWAVGAAMLASNAFFRDGHLYKGFPGWIISWFGGMYLFWIMFEYGLIAAIFIHFLHNFLIYAVHYIDAVIERHAYCVDE